MDSFTPYKIRRLLPATVPRSKRRKINEVHPVNIKQEAPQNAPEFIVSNKGGPKLIHRGFMYTLHKRQPTTIRWRCVQRTQNCKGSLLTDTQCKQPYIRTIHSHSPDLEAAENARQRSNALRTDLKKFFYPDGTLRNSSKRHRKNFKKLLFLFKKDEIWIVQ